MEIIKKIKLQLDKCGDTVVCKNTDALNMCLGTNAASGNKHMYNIKKENGYFLVPIEEVNKRILYMESRMETMNERLDIMKQIVGEEQVTERELIQERIDLLKKTYPLTPPKKRKYVRSGLYTNNKRKKLSKEEVAKKKQYMREYNQRPTVIAMKKSYEKTKRK